MTPMITLNTGEFSSTETQYILDYYPTRGARWCADQLNRHINSIHGRVARLGLKMTPEGKHRARCDIYVRPNEWYKVNPDQFFNIVKPEVAYFLGFLWADGYVKIPKRTSGGNYIIALNIAKDDYLSLDKVFRSLGQWGEHKVNKTIRHKKETICIRTGNKPLVEFLVQHDYHVKSLGAPTKILSKIPEHLKHYFWRGYFDGDGTFSCRKRDYHFAFSGPFDADWTEQQKILDSLCVSYVFRQSKRATGSSSVICSYNIKNVVLFGRYIYQGYQQDLLGLSRKYDKFCVAQQRVDVCDRLSRVVFEEPKDFVSRSEDILFLITKYPNSVTVSGILKHFNLTRNQVIHMLQKLKGKIVSHRQKCSYYSLSQ